MGNDRLESLPSSASWVPVEGELLNEDGSALLNLVFDFRTLPLLLDLLPLRASWRHPIWSVTGKVGERGLFVCRKVCKE
ncbi:hypothetical protein Caci_2902 [Catenulispora acidiphila DSM 44928]|uniref:Uncharacterized protein n=1 Tax=Catenulispora acidiphila (strain DSM 44928 / JCM 14897 / NBRC 102108 / NRRL B-24433 / ID139908) TaxID=479433 RepID=C7Q2R9_CATAD|nr:hypothetical protein Caci_2902 [Catenulispora acidiphila DSM 44928]